jgi:hypothetical protein
MGRVIVMLDGGLVCEQFTEEHTIRPVGVDGNVEAEAPRLDRATDFGLAAHGRNECRGVVGDDFEFDCDDDHGRAPLLG